MEENSPNLITFKGKMEKITTRAKSRAKRLSTIINSLHDLTSKAGDFPTDSPSDGNESEKQGEDSVLEPGIELTLQIKEEPVSDYSSEDPSSGFGRGSTREESSRDSVGARVSGTATKQARRKRGRPKKDALVNVPPMDSGLKRRQVRYKDHPCEICGKLFDSYYLKIHMRRHTGEKPFRCSQCSRTFCKKSQLKTHFQRLHGDPKDAQCNSCGSAMSSVVGDEVERTDKKRFECKVCAKEFRQMAHLTQHEKTHAEGKRFKCDLCSAEFKVKSSLEKHKETIHDGIKRVFPCHLCDKSFTRKAKLNDHVNFHLGQSRHLCEYCGKPFLSRKTLRTHLLIHEDKKPYLCQVCGRSFRQSNVLKLHMTTHTGIKPYKCQLCFKQFIHRVYMVRHQCPNKPIAQPQQLCPQSSENVPHKSEGC